MMECCCNDSIQGDMERATKRMINQCFNYEPTNKSVHRTVQEIFFSFSPMLGNQDKGFLESGSNNFKIMEQRLLALQEDKNGK